MPSPVHPLLVHLPLALAVIVPLVALALALSIRREWFPPRAGWLLVALQALLVGGAVLSLLTGEQEEERVERVVAEGFIDAHSQAAELFTWAAAIVLALALASMLLRARPVQRALATATLIGTWGVLGLGLNVGRLGGELVYRHGAAAAYAGLPGQSASDQDD